MAFPGLRLAVGTLTVVPVGSLPTISPAVGGRAMIIAPLAVLPLGLAAALTGWLSTGLELPGLITGLLMVGVLALGTRAMHLDGLADTADGLGSGWSPDRALAVMQRGDIGPMGVVTLIVTLGLQAVALGELVRGWPGAVAAGLVICASRAALVLVCRHGVPAARPTGLGVAVAGTVSRGAAALVWVLTAVVLSLAYEATGSSWWAGMIGAGLAAGAVLIVVRHCRQRFGGVTGDVMGAAVELAFTIMVIGAVAR